MRNSGNTAQRKSIRKIITYGLGIISLVAMFGISGVLNVDEDRTRLAEIKKEKEVSAVILEMGYPGEDPYASPGEEWELKEEEGSCFWYNPNTLARLVPVMNDKGESVRYWYYKASNGKCYRIDRDGVYTPEK